MLYRYIICLQSQLSGESDWSSGFQMIGQFFLLIIVFAFVLFLAYFSTKRLAAFKTGMRKNDFMKVVSVVPVGGGNSVSLLKVGERYFLLGVSKERIVCISEIDGKDIPEIKEEEIKLPFEKYFQEYFKKKNNSDDNEKKR